MVVAAGDAPAHRSAGQNDDDDVVAAMLYVSHGATHTFVDDAIVTERLAPLVALWLGRAERDHRAYAVLYSRDLAVFSRN